MRGIVPPQPDLQIATRQLQRQGRSPGACPQYRDSFAHQGLVRGFTIGLLFLLLLQVLLVEAVKIYR